MAGMSHERVTHTTTERTLGRLPSGADVAVTVHRYEGGDGPTVYVQAAQHGIELNGPATRTAPSRSGSRPSCGSSSRLPT